MSKGTNNANLIRVAHSRSDRGGGQPYQDGSFVAEARRVDSSAEAVSGAFFSGFASHPSNLLLLQAADELALCRNGRSTWHNVVLDPTDHSFSTHQDERAEKGRNSTSTTPNSCDGSVQRETNFEDGRPCEVPT